MQLGHVLIPVFACLCFFPQVRSADALIGGIALALTVGNPHLAVTRKLTQKLLAISVIGLGAGMNLNTVAKAGAQGFGYTIVSITFAMSVGLWLARRFKIVGDAGLLVTVGTAICGGSAIAAVAPAIRAKSEEVSVALAAVFCLNAASLVLFPTIGHAVGLDQTQFGLWAALAIHDTSSVVGATLQYGPDALQVGTTVKLARALWIVPLVWAISYCRDRQASVAATDGDKPKTKKPWFILGFIVMAALVTYVPALKAPGAIVETIAKRGLVVTLFLIGANLTPATLKSVGVRPLIHGVVVWLAVGVTSLVAIVAGLIH